MGGLLERRALINHICSGDVRLMPELKRDRVLRGEQLIRSGGVQIQTFDSSSSTSSSFPWACVLLCLCKQEATVSIFKVHA